MNNSVKHTMSNLTQRQIDHLDDYEYSLFLAYGDAYKPTPTVPLNRKRSIWETKAARLHEEIRGEILRFRKRLWGVINQRGTTLSDYQGRRD